MVGKGLRLGDGREDVRVQPFRHRRRRSGGGGDDEPADGAAEAFQDALDRTGRDVASGRHRGAGDARHIKGRALLGLGVELTHQLMHPGIVRRGHAQRREGTGAHQAVSLAQLERRSDGRGANDHHQQQAVLIVRGCADKAVQVVDLDSRKHLRGVLRPRRSGAG